MTFLDVPLRTSILTELWVKQGMRQCYQAFSFLFCALHLVTQNKILVFAGRLVLLCDSHKGVTLWWFDSAGWLAHPWFLGGSCSPKRVLQTMCFGLICSTTWLCRGTKKKGFFAPSIFLLSLFLAFLAFSWNFWIDTSFSPCQKQTCIHAHLLPSGSTPRCEWSKARHNANKHSSFFNAAKITCSFLANHHSQEKDGV